tara:strand:+ start:13258 stop:13911 length:654 start_codon:yes stop_codon:yes gene_type:complete
MSFAIIIPARGGSKRIPQKNLKKIGKNSLLSLAIQKSLMITSDVYVTTDNEEIAQEARSSGAKVVIRPKELATDTSKVEEAIKHLLKNIPANFDDFILLQATSPLVSTESIMEGISIKGPDNSVMSVCEVRKFIWNSSCVPINYRLGEKPRTQDMEPLYYESGAFYISSTKSFLETGALLNGTIRFTIIPEEESIDIDDPEDLDKASYYMNIRENKI